MNVFGSAVARANCFLAALTMRSRTLVVSLADGAAMTFETGAAFGFTSDGFDVFPSFGIPLELEGSASDPFASTGSTEIEAGAPDCPVFFFTFLFFLIEVHW